MRKYQFLSIRHPEEDLVELLNKLKSTSKGVFSYQSQKSQEYADNIFMDISHVGCFKTRRSSLAASTVWVIIDGEELKVTNITPSEIYELGISAYNSILSSFFHDFVAQYLDESWGDSVSISGEYISIKDLMSPEAYSALVKWESACNKAAPISHPRDYERWMEFVCQLYKGGINLSIEDFSSWLSEDAGWPTAYNDSIIEMECKLEYSIDLLKAYDNFL